MCVRPIIEPQGRAGAHIPWGVKVPLSILMAYTLPYDHEETYAAEMNDKSILIPSYVTLDTAHGNIGKYDWIDRS